MADPLIGKTEVKDSNSHVILTIDPDAAPVQMKLQDANGWLLMDMTGNTFGLHRGNAADPIVKADGQNASLRVGGPGAVGSIAVRDMQAQSIVVLSGFGGIEAGGNGRVGAVGLKQADGDTVVGMSASDASVSAGGGGTYGRIIARDDDGGDVITLRGWDATIFAGGSGHPGRLNVRDANGLQDIIVLQGASADITAGGSGAHGTLTLKGATGQMVVIADAANGDVRVGGGGQDGTVALNDINGQKVIGIDAASGNADLGGSGKSGDLFVRDAGGKDTIHLRASDAVVRVGANGQDGDLVMQDAGGKDTIHLRASDAVVRVGGNGQDGDVLLLRADNSPSLSLNASTGDIIMQNADCAEDFDLAENAVCEPGAVMVLDANGQLCPCAQQYDTAVVGVVAGAGDLRPGIVLDRHVATRPRVPLSVVGKVFCKVDATGGAIRAGDLLTSSSRPGHAMKASDRELSFGAVLGKALRPLEAGTGLIPIVVALQ